MIIGIDHVGVATREPEAAGELLGQLGLFCLDAGTASAYGVRCDFWGPLGGGAGVELVAEVAAGSAVTGVLDRAGPGLYHVAFEVDDLEAELARLRRSQIVLVDRTPCRGARPGMEVAFVYARRPVALLVELVQYRRVGGQP
jgi:methylmalonyl-CoA/ethylmalonyl-CoA epimerase